MTQLAEEQKAIDQEKHDVSLYLVGTLWTNRLNQIDHGKCYGCGNYVIHFADCKRMNLFRGIR